MDISSNVNRITADLVALELSMNEISYTTLAHAVQYGQKDEDGDEEEPMS